MANEMNSKKFWSYIIAAISILISAVYTDLQDNALNVPQVLLPYMPANSVATNYTLKALHGCFHWTSTKPEIAAVKPLFEGKAKCLSGGGNCDQKCSRSAVVTVVSASQDKETTVILAEEESSGALLRCDVFVDMIHRIEIATTTRELLLGESPEVFDVYGYDEEGNTFSSLGSTVFNWYLSPVTGNNTVDPETILRFLWFQESSYETEPEIYALEDKKLRGSSVIMEGINTGEALVSAKLVHSEYKKVPPSTVKLIVVDNIILHPSSDVYILVETTVFYHVQQLRRGHTKEIKMPSIQYQLKLSHPEYGILDHKMSSVTGKALGTTKVLLVDNNMMHTKSVRQPSATVHVVEPASIGFGVTPGNVWVLETGKEYAIIVELYDAKKHKIYFADNTVLTSMFPEDFLKVEFKSVNNSYHYVKAMKSGKTKINATLSGVQSSDGKKLLKLKAPVFGEQQVEIFDPIEVDPDPVIFPWEPEIAVGKSYKIQFKASGGSGSYHWSSQNYSMTSVTNKGLATSGNVIGSTKIKASDVKNSLHYGEATVIVLPAERMNFLPSAVEAEIGKDLLLPLSVAAYVVVNGRKELKVFEDCSRMPVKISFSDDRLFRIIDSSVKREHVAKGACKSLLVKAVKTGFTMVTATYHNGNKTLKTSVTIGAYPPLVVVDPSEIATVALGSSKVVALEGGPQPWILDSSGFFESLSAEEEEWVGVQAAERSETKVSQRSDKLHFFKVTCKQITGEQLLVGQVGNKPTAKNPFPASSVASLRFLCTLPGSLSLHPDIVLPIIDGHQMTLESCKDSDKRIPVRNNRELLILLVVRDANGQIFDNATSLDIRWSSSNNELAKILHKHSSVQKIHSNSTASAYQAVQLSAKTGFVKIEAKVAGYNKVALYAAGIYDDELKATINPPISGSLELMLVKDRQIVPNSLVLFNHPLNKANLVIKAGSGHYVVKDNDDALADILYKAKSEIMVTPRSAGRLDISVYDMCLDSESPAKAELTFSDIHVIDVVVADKVELYKTIKAVVQMKDHEGNLLSVRDMTMMKLAPKLSSQIIDFKPEFKGSNAKSTFLEKAVYTLHGLAVGVTSLTYNAVQSNGRQIRSKPRDVQVFPPLRLDPRHILLITGATFQVRSHGGPQPQSTTVFEIGNRTVSSVNHVGHITALIPGHTTLTGMAQGTDPHSGKTIVYSKDQITVEVITLKGFKIHAPVTTIISGSEIGIYAVGYNGERPFTFASSIPYLRFHWSLTNSEVASLKSVYHTSGITIKNEKDFRILLNTHKAGQATIKLKVEPADPGNKQILDHAILEDEIQIEVFDALKVLFPQNGELLLPQNINSKLKTNRDGIARMSYDVIRTCADNDKASVVDVASDGRIKTSTASGSANILITSHEDFGLKQTAVVHVEVKAVASITLVPLTLIPDGPDNLHFIPLSASAKFGVTLHDNVGRKFDVSTVPLRHRLHRFDVVQIVPDVDNATYSVMATGIGNAIFKVWDEHNENIADYMRINVDYGVQPSSATISLGSMVCFKSIIKTTKESLAASWSSSSSEVISIDSKTGIGIANSVGSATVYLSQGDTTTHVEIHIQKASSLRLAPSGLEAIVHNPFTPKQTFDIAVIIGDSVIQKPNQCDKTIEYGNKRSLRIPFSCSLTAVGGTQILPIETILIVRPKFVDGRPFCEISITDLPASILKQISTFDVVLSLQATLTDQDNDLTIQSDKLQLPFIPAFVLSLKEVQLSSDKPSVLIKVTGITSHLNNLKVESEDSPLVLVELLKTSLDNSHLDYEIKLVKEPSISDENITVIFESAVTGQKEKLHVQLEAGKLKQDTFVFKPQHCTPLKEKPHTPSITAKIIDIFGENSSFFLLYSLLIATVILIIIVYHNMIQRDRKRINQATAQPYYVYQNHDHGSPDQTSRSPYNQTMSFYQRNDSPYLPGSGKRGQSLYSNSPSTTPGNRTLFSVQQ